MEPVCTCSERTRINRRAILATTIDSKDNRPNGSAIRSFLNHHSGSSRSCFLIKETKRSKRHCNSDSEIKSREKEDGGLLLSEKFVRTGDEKQKCSSKVCETVLSGAETKNRLRQHVPTTGSCNNSTSSSSGELWEEEILLRHIKECRCTCNHMGYGNYLDWNERLSAVPPAPARCLTPRSYGSADCTPRLSLAHAHKKLSPGSGSLPIATDPSTPSDKGSAPRSWCLACMLLVLLTLTGIGVVLPLTARLRHGYHNLDHLSAVHAMLREVPLVDGHNDLAWNVRNFVHNQLQRFNFSADLRTVTPWATSSWSHTDLPRMQQGMLGAQFWSAYVPCQAQYKDAVQLTLEQINVIRRLVDSYSAELQFVTSSQGIETAHRAGRIASLVGVEGGHSLGASLGVLRAMYDLGLRSLTLTHTCHTPWADSSSAAASESNTRGEGLTEFGKVVVREMNRLGILVDLSHAAHETVIAVLETTRSPVIFSHSSAQALCNTSRNVPDHILRRVAENGGLVMVSFYADFLTCTAVARMEDVMRHLTHIRDVAGEDHVGIGAGYDGINRTPVGLEDVSRYPYLLAELARTKGWTMNQLEKLAGRNFLRVFRKVEKVKEELRRLAVDPYEDWIPPSDLQDYNKDGCLGR